MYRFFGKKNKKTDNQTTAAPAPVDLGTTIATIDTKLDHIDSKIRECDAQLSEVKSQLANTREGSSSKQMLKQRAMTILKRKRMLENQRNSMTTHSIALGQTDALMDSMKMNALVMSSMEDAKSMLTKQYAAISVAKVEDLVDELQEVKETSEEINQAMASLDMQQIDESELDAELEALEDLDLQQLQSTSVSSSGVMEQNNHVSLTGDVRGVSEGIANRMLTTSHS